MPDFTCPSCGARHTVQGRELGERITCSSCRRPFRADSDTLSVFPFPTEVRIVIRGPGGSPWSLAPVVIVVSRASVVFPPLRADRRGELVIDRALYQAAVDDWTATDVMSHASVAHARTLVVQVPSEPERRELARRRLASGWPATALEKKHYGSLEGLERGYLPPDAPRTLSARASLDLA